MSRPPRFSLVLLPLLAACAAHAQGVSPEAAPAAPEATSPQIAPATPQSEVTPIEPPPATPAQPTAPTEAAPAEIPPAPAPARLQAPSVFYQNQIIVAQGTPDSPVRFESAAGLIIAQQIQLDTLAKKLTANGDVQFERQRIVNFRELRPGRLSQRSNSQTVRETAFGQNLTYDFTTGKGQLDNANLKLATLSITTENLEINGQNYSARNVILRPGISSPEDIAIYGTPPFSLHARRVTLSPIQKRGETARRVQVRGGGLYVGGTRILPVPSYSFTTGGGRGNDQRITPGVSFNSADRFLVTTAFQFPLDQTDPEKLSARADIGLSARVGLRGGVGLSSTTDAGRFALNLRRNDVVTTQLTNRIKLDRRPELTYFSPAFAQFNLGKQRAGLAFDASLGDFNERLIGGEQGVSSTRARARLVFSTRLAPGSGAYARLFSVVSAYGRGGTYRNNGFEIGYDGRLLPRLSGQISLRATGISGQTPFRFDRVEIARELRATVDYQLSPRYILPVDLRYDLQRQSFRDETFGILRSYKTFAYGIAYQTARRDLRLELRAGF